MDYQTFKELCSSLGFTPDKLAPLLLIALVIIFIINRRFKPVEKSINKIEGYLIRMSGVIQTGGDLSKMALYQADSPIQLTPKGIEELEKIGFKKNIDDNLDLLIKAIDNQTPKSALEVEQLSIGLIRFLITDTNVHIFKESEDFIYKNPTYNNIEYFKAAGIYLRDKYLNIHPELVPSPNK